MKLASVMVSNLLKVVGEGRSLLMVWRVRLGVGDVLVVESKKLSFSLGLDESEICEC